MPETSVARDGTLRRFILLVFLGGWITAIVAFALFMRAWVPNVDLKAEMAAVEEAETRPAAVDGPTSAALRPVSGPLPSFVASGSVSVPMYSRVYVGGQRRLGNLAATVSVRNTSPDHALVVTSVAYFDRNGTALPGPIGEPHRLGPMATAEFYVDVAGAQEEPIATVVVGWGAETSVAPPLVDAVIVGSYGAKAVSFSVRGESRFHPL